jgi:hypothetical protein
LLESRWILSHFKRGDDDKEVYSYGTMAHHYWGCYLVRIF